MSSPGTSARPYSYATLPGTLHSPLHGPRFSKKIKPGEEDPGSVSLEQLTEFKGPVPEQRCLHSSAFIEKHATFFFGRGAGGRVVSSCYFFHFGSKTWKEIQSNVTPRFLHTTAFVLGKIFLLGGTDDRGNILDDLIEFDIATSQWTPKAKAPTPLAGHSATAFGNEIYAFGGFSDTEKPTNQLFKYSIESDSWTTISAQGAVPSARSRSQFFNHQDILYLYGGIDVDGKPLNCFHSFNPGNQTWSPVTIIGGTPPISDHVSGTYCHNSFFLVSRNRATKMTEIFELNFDTRRWIRHYNSRECGTYDCSVLVSRERMLFLFFGYDDDGKLTNRICRLILPLKQGLAEIEESQDEELPRSEWPAVVMKNTPSLLGLRERGRFLLKGNNYSYAQKIYKSKARKEVVDEILPIAPTVPTPNDGLARPASKEVVVEVYHYPERTDNWTALSYQTVLKLIMEHLSLVDYRKTVTSIEDESNVLHTPDLYTESRLVTILRIAMKRFRKRDLFDPDLFNNIQDPGVMVFDHLPGRADYDEDYDINVWEDPPEEKRKNLVRMQWEGKPIIRAGTLNKLIENLLPINSVDLTFVKAFLHTHQSFTSSEKLLKKVFQRYHVPFTVDEKSHKQLQEIMAKRVCDLIKYWIEKYAEDLNERCVLLIQSFIDGQLTNDGQMAHVKLLKTTIAKHLPTKKTKSSTFAQEVVEEVNGMFATDPPEPKVTQKIFSRNLKLVDIDEEEVARQLCLIESRIFSAIRPHEFFHRIWSESATNPSRSKAPHIYELMDRVQYLKSWVATSIVLADKAKTRTRMMEIFIRIAEHLRTFNNFQTLFGIVAGLNAHSVGITHAASEIQPRFREILAELTKIVVEERTYRECLEKASLPVTPSIDILVQDFHTTDRLHPDFINNLINFQKRLIQYKALAQIQKYQSTPYHFQPVYQIISFLTKQTKIVVNEKDLMEVAAKQRSEDSRAPR